MYLPSGLSGETASQLAKSRNVSRNPSMIKPNKQREATTESIPETEPVEVPVPGSPVLNAFPDPLDAISPGSPNSDVFPSPDANAHRDIHGGGNTSDEEPSVSPQPLSPEPVVSPPTGPPAGSGGEDGGGDDTGAGLGL